METDLFSCPGATRSAPCRNKFRIIGYFGIDPSSGRVLQIWKRLRKCRLQIQSNKMEISIRSEVIPELLVALGQPEDVGLLRRLHHLEPRVLQVLADVDVLGVDLDLSVDGQRRGFEGLFRVSLVFPTRL